MNDGWDSSAAAWIADMGETGDWSRYGVLDPAMLARIRALGGGRALDVGCGEGRFCRMLRAEGFDPVGIDPTGALLEEARRRDPDGDYRLARAEALPFENAAFDLVVSYLTLIDIPDAAAAIAEMARVLKPGGTLMIANLNAFSTAAMNLGWMTGPDGERIYVMDRYLDERSEWVAWRGISILNWHRPLSTYMSLLLGQSLTLTHFAEPEPCAPGREPGQAERYRRAPWFMVMEWKKP